MDDFDPATSFAGQIAEHYDDAPRGDEAACTALLAELAHGGPALEFAIGTGRVALPLASRGVQVSGIELSADMVAQLRARPGGAQVPVVLGDMTTEVVPGRFALVYLVFNTVFNLLSQDAQVRCFENAARHLDDDGVFLVEAASPWAWTPRGERTRAEWVTQDGVGLDVSRYDPVTQLLETNHVSITEQGNRFFPIVLRLAYPAELDLMARLAGLKLVDRWGGWHRQPFTADSVQHVSVYARS
ncbi:class I SAM-dependent methyltransferase [Kineosporia rhizophila]|uniref:class I SAM-dependent methyltransferase n=1 Tax=Kineosporia rhizophila TaxID=84633 RepID=UPI001E351D10|nr:class I SAM-dependent methyltransferase [Kineosporia rhizophila]MCE0540340.1 class I SAM-dependent methyltransferase [Kineosporia rhizophila]